MKEKIKLGTTALVILLLFGSVFVAGVSAEPKDDKAENIAKKIEKDLKETGKYSEKDLDELIRTLAKAHNRTLSGEEMRGAKEYALREIKKKIRLEKLKKRAISRETVKPRKVTSESGTSFHILAAGSIFTFKQPLVDIDGGSGKDDRGNNYNVEGHNDLYRVDVDRVPLFDGDTSCPVTGTVEYYDMYTLYYYDEDHRDPWWDAFYDDVRRATYGRIEDIETFYVRLGDNSICFDGIWSNNEAFYPFWGQHGNAIFPYTSTIYISVWNHAMDDDNYENPSLTFVSKP